MTAVNLNRAIRGPVTAVPVVAGKGVRLVADTVNNRFVVEADETVLFDGTVTLNVNAEVAISEPLTNFEFIQVWVGRIPNENSYELCTIAPTGTYINVHTSWVQDTGTQLNLYEAKLSVGTTKLTVVKEVVKALGDSQHTSSTSSPMTLKKVVGINRIASN